VIWINSGLFDDVKEQKFRFHLFVVSSSNFLLLELDKLFAGMFVIMLGTTSSLLICASLCPC
jgi:hypothetical protein